MNPKYYLILFVLIMGSTNSYSFSIGTGGKTAVFYPTGKALCTVYNKYYDNSCNAISTKGSKYNLDHIILDDLDTGISQTELQYNYYNYQNHQALRTIIPLHTEALTIAVAKDSKIKSFDDLKGKKVNIGNIGSGSRVFTEQIISIKGWSLNDFKKIYEKSSMHISDLICGGEVDAIIYFIGHPNKIFQEIKDCGGRLISLSRKEIKSFSTISKSITKTKITKHLYNYPEDTKTIGIPIVLSTTEKLPAKHAYNLAKMLFEHKDELSKLNPIFLSIDPKSLTQYKYRAPLHEGVKQYLEQR